MTHGRLSRVFLLLIVAGALPFSTGCTYTQNRLTDLVDCFGVRVGVGFGADARATQYLEMSGLLTVSSMGFLGRTPYPAIGFTGGMGVSPLLHFRETNLRAYGVQQRLTMIGKTLLDPRKDSAWHQWENDAVWTWFPGRSAYNRAYDRRLYDVGLSLYMLLGIDFDVNPVELVDFLAGLFTVDLVGDDKAGERKQQEE